MPVVGRARRPMCDGRPGQNDIESSSGGSMRLSLLPNPLHLSRFARAGHLRRHPLAADAEDAPSSQRVPPEPRNSRKFPRAAAAPTRAGRARPRPDAGKKRDGLPRAVSRRRPVGGAHHDAVRVLRTQCRFAFTLRRASPTWSILLKTRMRGTACAPISAAPSRSPRAAVRSRDRWRR